MLLRPLETFLLKASNGYKGHLVGYKGTFSRL
jgi:hypothetical protein